jgi:hypothetical protein
MPHFAKCGLRSRESLRSGPQPSAELAATAADYGDCYNSGPQGMAPPGATHFAKCGIEVGCYGPGALERALLRFVRG